jgi:hypothetical protein
LGVLGKGGFGEVVSVRNRLDGRIYAIKKIRLKRKFKAKIIREVKMLSRLYHKNIIRYYQSWIEVEAPEPEFDAVAVPNSARPGSDEAEDQHTPYSTRMVPHGDYSADSLVESIHHPDDDDYSSTLDIGGESDWLRESIPSYHYRGAALMHQHYAQRQQYPQQPNKTSPPLQPGRLVRQKSIPRMVARNLATELSDSNGYDEFAIHDRDWNLEHGADVFQFDVHFESERRSSSKTNFSTPFGSSSTASTATPLSGSLSGSSLKSPVSTISPIRPSTSNTSVRFDSRPLKAIASPAARDEADDLGGESGSNSITSRSENEGEDDDYSDVSFSSCNFGKSVSKIASAKGLDIAVTEPEVDLNKPRTIAPGSWEMEECDLCGTFYHDWAVPNEHWDNLQMGMRNMSLCEMCYAEQLRQSGVDIKSIKIKQVVPVVEQPQFLYIQMDYCERTLRHVIDEGTLFEGNGLNSAWRIFGQILEGLVCIQTSCQHSFRFRPLGSFAVSP